MLRISIRDFLFLVKTFGIKAEWVGLHDHTRFTLSGMNIDICILTTGIKAYETGFGDQSLAKPHPEYSNFRVRISLHRDAAGLFWKMFLGMYLAFLIAYTCFYIHADSIDSRFGLSVGSLFAVIGNKYIIDSSLPESTSFTLVDTLHGLTLFFIFTIIASTTYSLFLVKKDKAVLAHRFDMMMAKITIVIYVAANAWFISQAGKG